MSDSLERFQSELLRFVRSVYVGDERRVVYGEGAAGAPLMLIGEAPGEQEALQGRPFAGRAGKNLDAFLELAGLSREALYVTNAVKFRPTRLSAAGRVTNRPPTREEVALMRPWLLREIGLVRPRCIATLGNVPLPAVTGARLTVGEAHGTRVSAPDAPCPVFALYHPASLLYRRSLTSVYERDVAALAAFLRSL